MTFTRNRSIVAAILATSCLVVPASASADSLPSTYKSDAAQSGSTGSPPSTDRSDAAQSGTDAAAQPTDDLRSADAKAAGQAQNKQDLRSPDARAAVNAPGATAVESATDAREQDLRHLRAGGDIPTRPLPGPPTWPAHPQPLTPAPAANVTDGGNGVNWTTIALGIAGSLLAITGITALTARSRRLQRQRATA